MQIRVYYEDTDLGGVVYHANYLKFCERARSEAFFKAGKSPIVKEGHFVARNITMDFISPSKLGDLLEVKSQLVELKGVSFSLLQEIFIDGLLIFNATIKLAFINEEKPTKIPAYLREDLQKIFTVPSQA